MQPIVDDLAAYNPLRRQNYAPEEVQGAPAHQKYHIPNVMLEDSVHVEDIFSRN